MASGSQPELGFGGGVPGGPQNGSLGGHRSEDRGGRAGLREGEKQIDKHTKERYGQFGLIDDDVVAYSALLPGKPVWITEWGVLGQSRADQGENVAPPSEVAEYAENFIKRLQTRFAGQVAAAMWYAWAHYMDDGYGLVDRSGNDNGDFRQRYLKL